MGAPVLGLDPSLTCTGWGLLDAEGGYLASGAWRHRDGCELDRRAAYCEELRRLIGGHAPGLVAVEAQYVGPVDRGDTILRLAALRGALTEVAMAMGVRVIEMQPSVAKQALAWGGADKPAMVAHANARWELKLGPGDHDVADALAVALAAARMIATPEQAVLVL